MNKHWTETSIQNFRYRITSDFLDQLIKKMKSSSISRASLAKRLGVSPGRVSQILNGEMANFSLDKIIRYARVLGLKVAIVAYEDFDPDNARGPLDAEIFNICWEKMGSPTDFSTLIEPERESEQSPYFTIDGTSASLSNSNNVVSLTGWSEAKIEGNQIYSGECTGSDLKAA